MFAGIVDATVVWHLLGFRLPAQIFRLRPGQDFAIRPEWLPDLNARLGAALDHPEGAEAPDACERPPDGSVDALLHWCFMASQRAKLIVVERGRALASAQDGSIRLALSGSPRQDRDVQRLLAALLRAFDAAASNRATTQAIDALRGLIARIADQDSHGDSNTPQFIRAALDLDIPVLDLQAGLQQFGWGARSHRFRSSFCDTTNTIAVSIARDKAQAANLMRQAGIPVPDHTQVVTVEQALAAARRYGYPVVVKPANRDGGEGVHAWVDSDDQVRAAFDAVVRLGARVLVERHVPGCDYRVVVLDGEVVAALERRPGGVTGDGVSTVGQLLDRVNREPGRGDGPNALLKPIALDEEALAILARQGLDIHHVPARDAFIALRHAANFARGGSAVAARDRMHPDNRALAIRATAVVGLDLCGVDLLMPDISRSWLETGAAICEVNGAPYLGQRKPIDLFSLILGRRLPDGGRIPVVAVLGADDALIAAIEAEAAARGIRLGVARETEARLAGSTVAPALSHPVAAARALLLDPGTGALLLAPRSDTLLSSGLPVDRVDLLALVDSRAGAPADDPLRVLPAFRGAASGLLCDPGGRERVSRAFGARWHGDTIPLSGIVGRVVDTLEGSR